MSLLEEIIAAGKETISGIKNIPGQIKTLVTPKKSILEEVEQEPNVYISPEWNVDPFKSKFYTPEWQIRATTKKEEDLIKTYLSFKNESEIEKTVKAPFRWLQDTGKTFAYWTAGLFADFLDLVSVNPAFASWSKDVARDIRWAVNYEKAKDQVLGEALWQKWVIDSIQQWELSWVVRWLSWAAGSTLFAWRLSKLWTAIATSILWWVTWGNISLEWEQQWKTWAGTKLSAYSSWVISSLLDIVSGSKFINLLEKSGLDKKAVKTVSDKFSSMFSRMKTSDTEAITEIAQQGIEDIWRYMGGIDVSSDWKDYAEAGLLWKVIGKIGDYSESKQKETAVKAYEEWFLNEEDLQQYNISVTPEMKEAHQKNFDQAQQDITDNIENFANDLKDEGKENELDNFIEELPDRYKTVAINIKNSEPVAQVSLLDEKSINQIQNNFDSATIKTRPQILVNWLKSLGLKVSTKKSPVSDSIYLNLKNNW